MRTLISDCMIIPVDGEEPRWFTGDIAIDGTVLTHIGKVPDTFAPDRVIEASGKIALPGLVNTHNHLSMTLLRSYADDMDLFTWLREKIWPIEAKMGPEHIYAGSMLGLLEQIAGGITTFADMYFHPEMTIEAVKACGVRASIGATFMGEQKESLSRVEGYRTLIEETRTRGDGLVDIAIAPHAIYTCSTETLRIASELARQMGCRIHTHLSESTTEVQDCFREHGMSPVAYLEKLGLLGPELFAAHCVHLSEEDIVILSDSGTHVVHNPTSNLKLGNGVAPVHRYLSEGMRPALGTDGASSNNNLNMFEEMHLCSLIHKGNTHDPRVVTAYQTLQMATINGACALGLDDTIGSLEVGKEADLILVDTAAAHLQPVHDPVSAIVYSAQASDVRTVFCAGKLLYNDRRMVSLDTEEILQRAAEAAAGLHS